MDIHDVQDWMKVAPLRELQELLWYGQGVLEARQRFDGGRKRRKDAGIKRGPSDDNGPAEDRKLFEQTQGG